MTTPPDYAGEFSTDGRYLAVGSAQGYVELWDLEAKVLVFRWQPHNGKRVQHVVFGPDGTLGTLSYADDSLRILNLRDLRTKLRKIDFDW
jgi:WD40 repeat protein